LYVNGPVPELTFTCALPLEPPKQLTLLLLNTVTVGPPMLPTFAEVEAVHPFASVTVTTYPPEATLEIEDVFCPPDQEYV